MVQKRVFITDPVLRSFPAPATPNEYYWDSRLRGFGVRVSNAGTKTFVALVARGRRKAIGRYPLMSLQSARDEAKRILAEKVLGKVRPTHTAFDEAKADFLAESQTRLKPRTVADYSRHLRLHYQYGRKSVAEVTSRDIVKNLNKLLQTPSERHHAYATGRTFFEWCIHQHIITSNPMASLDVKPAETKGQRALTDAELAKALKLTQDAASTFKAMIALLVLTGQRKCEINALEWGWIGKDSITLPPNITKNKQPHAFPIGPMTLKVLSRVPKTHDKYLFPAAKNRFKNKPATVFNSWGNSKADFDEELDIAPWKVHDLRRTLRTKWAELVISPEVAEKYINHVSGTHGGLDAIYNHYKYEKPMQNAVEVWERHLQSLLKD